VTAAPVPRHGVALPTIAAATVDETGNGAPQKEIWRCSELRKLS